MTGRVLLIALMLMLPAVQAPARAQSEELRAKSEEVRALKRKARQNSHTQPAESLAAARRALEIAEAAFGPDHVEVADVLAQMAWLHAVKHRFAEAAPLERRAIAIMEKSLGADRAELADFLIRIASPHRRKRFDYVRPLYMRALDIYERAWADDPRLPMKVFFMAYDIASLGHHGDAIPLYERAHALAKRLLPPDNHALLVMHGHLSGTYLVRGRYVDAERAVRRDMAMIARWLGSEQQDAVLSRDLRRLASVYFAQGYYGEAERLNKRAQVIDLKPGESPSPEAVARETASNYHAQGRYAEAAEIYEREFARLEAAYGPAKAELDAAREKLKAMGKVRTMDDIKARQPLSKEVARLSARVPSTTTMANLLATLGAIRHKEGKPAEAEILFAQALGLLGDSNEQTVVVMTTQLAHLYADNGEHAKAEQLYISALKLDEDDENWGRPMLRTGVDAAAILNGLGRLARRRNEPERAEEHHKHALEMLERLGPDRFDVAGTLGELAELYRSQGRIADAEPLYRRALEIYDKGHMSPDHTAIRTLLANLGAFYVEQGRTADAEALARGPLREPSHR
jgi:tetratricopeptide (TPR) repeat protein